MTLKMAKRPQRAGKTKRFTATPKKRKDNVKTINQPKLIELPKRAKTRMNTTTLKTTPRM
ncbi:hypothetical protein Bhyg_07621 [Pseudolycoriella hygida]|uniref:Uncharacterized protein n=1 Tax=Pseudolycoriella hygida TaxID=35572 RepID=A0A9Q0N307_9DIPT|nr:hypothetical protein Bhyg_07621 [Pseudolycoriella hygida]